MKVALKTPYLSIVELPEIELPAFTVITGVNGSGKTHLLKGIVSGNLSVDVAPNHSADARYFDWTTLIPNDAVEVDGHSLFQARDRIWTHVEQAVGPHRQSMSDAARSAGLAPQLWRDPKALALLTLGDLTTSIPDMQVANTLHKTLQRETKEATRSVSTQLVRQGVAANLIQQMEERLGLPIVAVERSEFAGSLPIDWGAANPFQQSFAQLFVTYRNLRLENALKKQAKSEGEEAERPLSSEEFEAKYNIPPWDFVNSALEDAGLDFKIDSPYLHTYSAYHPKLRKLSTNAAISFSDLSSGEKVLMSFALCLYYSRDDRQIAKYPRLLLLDEIDSPLHPSMSRQLIKTIAETLVENRKINVILATHSPSTVALVDEESLYIMKPDSPRLSKVAKGYAINILTSGVPTLAISCDGRRQVIVESDRDAWIYDRLYQALKSVIESERSLVFIGAGTKPPGGKSDQNGGCAQVKRIVQALVDGGNASVFGLVDWDTRNVAAGRVCVLAEGRRYSIESCIYDPVLLAAFAALEGERREEIGLQGGENFRSFETFDAARLQDIADRVERLVLGSSDNSSTSESVDSCYHGGLRISLRKAYVQCQGHDLEAKIKEVFAPFRKYHHPGELMGEIVKKVVENMPSLVPQDLIDALRGLLSADIALD